jgi:hypothetical protein
MSRIAPARINGKLRDRLAEQVSDGEARHFVREVKRVHIHHPTDIAFYGTTVSHWSSDFLNGPHKLK